MLSLPKKIVLDYEYSNENAEIKSSNSIRYGTYRSKTMLNCASRTPDGLIHIKMFKKKDRKCYI